jgi:hypothetical protein
VAELLAARRTVLMEAARVLTAKETITGDELRALVNASAEREQEVEGGEGEEASPDNSLSHLGV